MSSVLQLPSYKGFKGTIEELATNQFINSGEVAIIDSTTIEISELPVKTWTQVSPEPPLVHYTLISVLLPKHFPFPPSSNMLPIYSLELLLQHCCNL